LAFSILVIASGKDFPGRVMNSEIRTSQKLVLFKGQKWIWCNERRNQTDEKSSSIARHFNFSFITLFTFISTVCPCMYTGFLIYFAAVERYMIFISQCWVDYWIIIPVMNISIIQWVLDITISSVTLKNIVITKLSL